MINAGTICSYLTLDTGGFKSGIGSAVAQLGILNDSSATVGDQVKGVGGAFETAGLTLTKGLTVPIAGAGIAAGKFAIDFESAFIGVRKTVDATEEQYASLRKGILDMTHDIPASAEEISGVAEAAGQLGIQTDNILGFTRTMVDLGEATNLTAQQGATELARFANITQMSQKEFSNLGSTIVELGNNLATTESEISSMSLRLAGAGHQVGMTEAQILGFAGALSSVGIEAEAGGSAMSKVMVKMQLAAQTGAAAKEEIAKTGMTLRELQMLADQDAKSFKALAWELGYTGTEFKALMSKAKDLDNFSQVCQMTGAEFSKAFGEDAAGTITKFIDGLGAMKENGGDAIAVLDNMGITEIRMRDALLRAAGAGDVFANSLDMATGAWKENTALAHEAEQRYASTESQLKLLWNDVKGLGIEFGDVLLPGLRDIVGGTRGVIQSFAGLDDGTKKVVVSVGMALAALGPVTTIVGKTTRSVGTLINGMDKGVQIVGKLGTKMSGLGGTLGTVGGKLAPLTGGFSGLGITLGSFLGTAGIIAGVVGGFYLLGKSVEEGCARIDKETAEHIRKSSENVRSFAGTLAEAKSLTTDFQWKIVEAGQKASDSFTKQIGAYNTGIMELVTKGTRVAKDTWKESNDQLKGLITEAREFIDTQSQEQTQSLVKIWTSTGTLMDAENQSILQKITETGEEKKEKYDGIEKQIDTIMSGAINKRGYLLEKEKDEILRLMAELQGALNADTTNYADYQKAVLSRIKSEASTITFDTAQTLIKTSEEARDKRIAAAQQACDEEVAALQQTLDSQKNLSNDERIALQTQIGEKQRILQDEVAAAKLLHAEAANDVAARYAQENQAVFDCLQEVSRLNQERYAKQQEYNELMAHLYEGDVTEQEERARKADSIQRELLSSQEEYKQRVSELLQGINSESQIAFMQMINETITSGGKLSAENEALANAIADAYTKLPPDMEETARAGMEALLKGMTDEKGQVINTSNMTIQEMADVFRSLPKETEDTGKNTAKGFEKGYLAQQIPTFKVVEDASKDILKKINDSFEVHSPSKATERTGIYVMEGLGGGMTKGKSSVISNAKGIGVDIIRGMEDGLDSRKGALISKANGIANQITYTIRKALDIHSPSRVARGLGQYFMDGWGLGMEENIKKVLLPVQKAAGGIIGAASIDTPEIQFRARARQIIGDDIGKKAAIAQAADHLQRGNPVQYLADLIINLDGRNIAKATALWDNQVQGDNYNRLVRLGGGL